MQTRLFTFLSTEIKNVLSRQIHYGRCLLETHYDVLKLPRSCSPQEIRSSFIKLSKEYHPDKNTKDDKRHALFVRLNEAYTVLSRPDTRREYDLSLIPNPSRTVPPNDVYGVHEARPFEDSSFWENRDKSKMDLNRPYYGIKGLKKMSNGWIVILCLIFTALGVGLQVFLIRQSVSFTRKSLDDQSQENARTYAMVREKATREGDESMFRRIERNAERFVKKQRSSPKKEN